jgi:2-hydroxychromene-2-carboxylate isomerase
MEGECARAVRMLAEWIRRRIELWEEFAKAAHDCHWRDKVEACREAERLARALGLKDAVLLNDPWYDHDCAYRLAEELKRILKAIGCEEGC